LVVVFFFVGAILACISHGARRDTVNQFENADRHTALAMTLLIIGEVGGFAVILAGSWRWPAAPGSAALAVTARAH
jgi:hypothetical protein